MIPMPIETIQVSVWLVGAALLIAALWWLRGE